MALRRVSVMQHGVLAGYLNEQLDGRYTFKYSEGYQGSPVSLTMPTLKQFYEYVGFPPVFEGLLPEGSQLEALLRQKKIDRHDLMGQLLAVGADVVGSLSIIVEEP